MDEQLATSSVSIENLPAEDILFNLIFPRLEPDDWISLSRTNNKLNKILKSFFCTNKTLFISHLSNISPPTFKILTENSSNLRNINLSRCSWITDDLLKPVLRNNNNLHSIDLSFCDRLTEGILQILTVQCPHISYMVLRSCPWVVSEALDYMAYHHNRQQEHRQVPNTEDILQAMGKGLRTNIQAKTKSKYCGKEHLYHNLQTKEIKPRPRKFSLSKLHQHLIELDISGCEMIREETIVNFVKVFHHLQVLRLGNNFNITDLAMKTIATNLKDLSILDIRFCSKISNAGLFTVAKYCKKLKYVEVGNVQFPANLLKLVEGRGIRVKKGAPETQTNHQNLGLVAGPSGADFMDGILLGIEETMEHRMK